MGLFERLGITNQDGQAAIDWEITPALTFTIFESWGSKERIVRSSSERYYYFFIDNWEAPPKVCLMERGIKHVRVLAEIDAPREMIDRCIQQQGAKSGLDKCYAVDETLKEWLIKNVLEGDGSLVRPVAVVIDQEDMDSGLPGRDDGVTPPRTVTLPSESTVVQEDDLPGIIEKYNFFDTELNPDGRFENCLVDNGDGLTVTDLVTGVVWQRQGCDITSIRNVNRYVEGLNSNGFAGHDDWRLPTVEEAWSLMEHQANEKGLFLHKAFSKKQPFIFVAAQRQPGGYWFMDYKQGRIFWASGTIPGGFGRVCRNA